MSPFPIQLQATLDAVLDDELAQLSNNQLINHIHSLRDLGVSLHTRMPTAQDYDALTTLLTDAHHGMARARGADNHDWRVLYTFASVLKAIAYLKDEDALNAVRTLDLALIVAKAPGREELVLELIVQIQEIFLPSPSTSTSKPSSAPICPTHIPLPGAALAIPRLDKPPSLSAFASAYSQAPFILPSFAAHWPAIERWRSHAYLRTAAGAGRVVPVEAGADYRSPEWAPKIVSWDAFLQSLEGAEEVLYLAQHDLLAQFPALRTDIEIPDYVYAVPAHPPEGYAPPGNEDALVVNAWLGPKGTVSPPHTDPFYNFYTQVVGHKTIWLAPPSLGVHMYAFSDAASHMSNTSRVDVFADALTISEHPDFWEHVPPHAMVATLNPGDVLFFPPGWWHAMRAEGESFSVSMWF